MSEAGMHLAQIIADTDNPYLGAQVNLNQVEWVLSQIPDEIMKINGAWHWMDCFTQYRQRHERGMIQIAQGGDCWMDGKYLWRIAE